jgi:hypothetical protein
MFGHKQRAVQMEGQTTLLSMFFGGVCKQDLKDS